MEGTPYICQEQWVNISSQIPQFLFKTCPWPGLNITHQSSSLYTHTGRESLPQHQLGTPELGCHGPTPEAAPAHSPVLLGHILVVDVPADVAVRGADALAANVLGALQGTGAM